MTQWVFVIRDTFASKSHQLAAFLNLLRSDPLPAIYYFASPYYSNLYVASGWSLPASLESTYGVMAAQWHCGKVAWWYGGMVAWWYGGMVVWWHGGRHKPPLRHPHELRRGLHRVNSNKRFSIPTGIRTFQMTQQFDQTKVYVSNLT